MKLVHEKTACNKSSPTEPVKVQKPKEIESFPYEETNSIRSSAEDDSVKREVENESVVKVGSDVEMMTVPDDGDANFEQLRTKGTT